MTKDRELAETDLDLYNMRVPTLVDEIRRLRNGIRQHRDQCSHNRCWLDDQELYRLLPEQANAVFTLPPQEEFLRECARFWKQRQPQLS